MATKRDLVEAHAFSRRRLVTAFVSGAPGGREVEPARPGRVIIGGAALSVLLIAGAAIGGIFSQGTPEDWAQPGLFISEETGAAYVITEESDPAIVRPVINITSAKLIIGGDAAPVIVQQAAINGETIGEDIGILGAPATPPTTDTLIPGGWSACSGAGIRVAVQSRAGVSPQVSGGVVVSVGSGARSAFHLLASTRGDSGAAATHSYLLPRNEGARDRMLDDMGLQASSYNTAVSEQFLSLFPSGGDLALPSLGLTGRGRPATYADAASGLPSGSRVGDIVIQPDQVPLLLTQEGPAEMDPFAYAVYRNLPRPPREVTMEGQLGRGQEQAPYLAAQWPTTVLEPVLGEVCAQLFTEPDAAPYVQLASDPDEVATSAEIDGPQVSVRVQAGRGAYVLSGDWSDGQDGAPFLIDSKGKRYALEGGDAATLLGFGGYDAPVVPDTWVELFRSGVALSRNAALCPPETEAGQSCG